MKSLMILSMLLMVMSQTAALAGDDLGTTNPNNNSLSDSSLFTFQGDKGPINIAGTTGFTNQGKPLPQVRSAFPKNNLAKRLSEGISQHADNLARSLVVEKPYACGKTDKGETVYCSKEELLNLYHQVQSATKKDSSAARITGKILLGIGVTWAGSVLIDNATFGAGLRYGVIGQFVPRTLWEPYVYGGFFGAPVLAAIGGTMLWATSGEAHAGTLTDQYVSPRALPQTLKLSDKEFLAYSKIDPRIAQNIVAAAVLLQRNGALNSDEKFASDLVKKSGNIEQASLVTTLKVNTAAAAQ